MVLSVIERRFDANHRISGENTMYHRLTQTLFDSGDVFLRNNAADDRIDEFKIRSLGRGLKAHLDNTELTAAAGLLFVLAFGFRCRANGLTVRDARIRKGGFHVGLIL